MQTIQQMQRQTKRIGSRISKSTDFNLAILSLVVYNVDSSVETAETAAIANAAEKGYQHHQKGKEDGKGWSRTDLVEGIGVSLGSSGSHRLTVSRASGNVLGTVY